MLHSHGSLHPQFASPKNATYFSIRAVKPSQTAGTLCASFLKILWKILQNHIDNGAILKYNHKSFRKEKMYVLLLSLCIFYSD
jgi:hypothetical protein